MQLFLILFALVLISCRDNTSYFRHDKINHFPILKFDENDTTKGVYGIVVVPEFWCILLSDSASDSNIQKKYAEDIIKVMEEYYRFEPKGKRITGSLIHTNDPKNFKFDVFAVLSEKPADTIQPQNGKLYLMKSDTVILCNHYGSYRHLYKSYQLIRTYMERNALVQKDVMRELYVTDPTETKDTSRWLTRIMVPVKAKED